MIPAALTKIECDWTHRDGRGARRLSPQDRDTLFNAHLGRCWWCGIAMRRDGLDFYREVSGKIRMVLEWFTVDHILPFQFGGLTVPWNIVAACRRCNVARVKPREIKAKRAVAKAEQAT